MTPLVTTILNYGADVRNYAVTGSAALILRRLLPRKLGDLDVIARGLAWDCFAKRGNPVRVAPFGSQLISITVKGFGEIEIFDEWMGDRELTNRLIDTAELVTLDGKVLPLALPQATIRYKSVLMRRKDQQDLEYLKEHYPRFFQTE